MNGLLIVVVACCFQNLISRPRRNRRSPHLREAFQEAQISPANFILPLFIHEGTQEKEAGRS